MFSHYEVGWVTSPLSYTVPLFNVWPDLPGLHVSVPLGFGCRGRGNMVLSFQLSSVHRPRPRKDSGAAAYTT